VAVGAAGRLDIAAGGGADTTRGVAVGGEALFRLERRSIGGLATAGVLTPTDTKLGYFWVREQRFPISLSATMRWHINPRMQVMGELGLSMTPLTLAGEGFSGTSVMRLDVGPRGGFQARLTTRKLVAFAELHVEYFPGAHTISVPQLGGEIGTSAPWQIGFSLGVEIPVHNADEDR
jgi:hypothetical protein